MRFKDKRLAHGSGRREGETGRERKKKQGREGEKEASSFEGPIPDLSDFRAHTGLRIFV